MSRTLLRNRQRLWRTEPQVVDRDDNEESQQYEKYGHDALGLAGRSWEEFATAKLQRARRWQFAATSLMID